MTYNDVSYMSGLKVYDFRGLKSLTQEQLGATDEALQRDTEARKDLELRRKNADYRVMHDMEHATLYTGQKIPLVGLGTWKAEPGQVEEAVVAAIKAGYRHIDCAAIYQNEREVGRALARVLADGVVKREELFITTKLWNSDHHPSSVEAACRRSLQDLQLRHLDLYLVHWPVTGVPSPQLSPSYASTWAAMEALVDRGLARAIGVSNLSAAKLQLLLEGCRIRPAVNQVEAHPYFRNEALLAACAQAGVHVTAYSPLGSPDSASVMRRRHTPALLRDPLVEQLAAKYGRDAGQVLIRWALQRGTSALPKSTRPERIRSNLDVFDWRLDQPDFDQLSQLATQLRMVDGALWLHPQGPYRSLAELWDDPDEDGREARYVESLYERGLQLPEVELGPGLAMPLLGLGTWKAAPGEVRRAVVAAIRAGHRHIDCAEVYQNEEEVGQALREVFDEGVVRREELWVTGKLWNSDHAPSRVEPAIRKSLRALGLRHLDLYLVHWPVTGVPSPQLSPSYASTWAAMEALVDRGLARAIGVSNLSAAKLQLLLEGCRIRPAVNQVEAHPYFRNEALLAACAQAGVHVTAYSPLGSPDSASLLQRQAPVLLQDPVVLQVAQELGRSPAQVLIRWGLQRGTSVLAKSTKAARIRANLDVLSWQLPEQAMARLSALQLQQRMVDGSFWMHPKGPYRSLAELWDE